MIRSWMFRIDVRALLIVAQMTDNHLGSETSFLDAGYCLDNQTKEQK